MVPPGSKRIPLLFGSAVFVPIIPSRDSPFPTLCPSFGSDEIQRLRNFPGILGKLKIPCRLRRFFVVCGPGSGAPTPAGARAVDRREGMRCFRIRFMIGEAWTWRPRE